MSAAKGSFVANLKEQFDSLETWQKAAVVAGVVGGAAALAYTLSNSNSSIEQETPASEGQTRSTTQKTSMDKSYAAAVAGSEAPVSNDQELAKKQANKFKKEGNNAYKNKQWREAIAAYTKALATLPENDEEAAVYHCNRAAAHLMLGQSEKVVSDCTLALKFRPQYVKALHRRAQAFEAQKKFREAVKDLTVVYYIDNFKNDAAQAGMDRLMQAVVSEELQRLLANRSHSMPAQMTVDTHFETFGSTKHWDKNSFSNNASENFPAGIEHFNAKEHEKAREAFLKAVEDLRGADLSDSNNKKSLFMALCMSGSYAFLTGRYEDSLQYLDEAVPLGGDQQYYAFCRRSALQLEIGQVEKAIADAVEAEKSKTSFGYIAKGQVMMVVKKLPEVIAAFEKATKASPKTYVSHVHLILSKLQTDPSAVLPQIQNLSTIFPDSSFVAQFKGEMFLNFGMLAQAVECFNQALELDSSNPNALVNLGMATIQTGKLAEGKALIEKALEIDPRSEVAFARLGEIALNTRDFEAGFRYYDKAIECATVPAEIQTIVQQKEAAILQKYIIDNFPDLAAKEDLLRQASFSAS